MNKAPVTKAAAKSAEPVRTRAVSWAFARSRRDTRLWGSMESGEGTSEKEESATTKPQLIRLY